MKKNEKILYRWIKKVIFPHFFCGSILLNMGCQSPSLKVESQPEGADVYLTISGQTTRKVGVTPLTLNENQINPNNDSLQISISKEGYARENILAPATIFSKFTAIQITLRENSAATVKQTLTDEILQKLASQVAYTQSLIKNKDYDNAERTLSNLLSQFPSVSTLHELMGNVFYIRKDLSKAHGYYRKAYDLNPTNPDTLRLIQKIETIRPELRAPATNGGPL